MPKIKITKEEADRMMRLGGRQRGLAFVTDANYILTKKGEEGLKKVEKRLEQLGYPIKLKSFSSFKWYSLPLGLLVMLVIFEVFDWDDSIAFDMGYEAPFQSPVVKMMLEHILGIEKIFKNTSRYWRRYFDIGEMKTVDYDLKKRRATLHLYRFKKYCPQVYDYFRGFLTRLFEMVTKSQKVKVEQSKSIFKNDSYDNFEISW